MNKGIFGLGMPLLFILLGFGLLTDENWQIPAGGFTVKNYTGIIVLVFFGTLFILGIIKLVSQSRNTPVK